MLGGRHQWESLALSSLSTAVVLCLCYNSCMPCVLGPQAIPALQSHQIAPWSWRITQVGGLGCLGMGEIILLTLWLCQSQLQTDLCNLACGKIIVGGGEVAARCWGLGRGTEGALLDGQASMCLKTCLFLCPFCQPLSHVAVCELSVKWD